MMTYPKRFIRNRVFTATAIGATTLLALTACGGGGAQQGTATEFTGEYTGPKVELDYWNGFTGGDGPFMEQMVEEFNAEHDNIKVVPNTIKWADMYQKLPAAVQAGEGPDVGVMHLEQLSTNAARNVIVPVDDLAEELELTGDDFTEEVWDAGVYEDKRYGIPLDVHSLAMYYNTEHFEKAGITEAPTDAASFEDALKKLKAAGYDNPFWMPAKWPSHLMNLSLLWQNGGEPYDADGAKATFDSEAGVEGLEWQTSIIEDGYSPKNVAIDSQYVAFKNGENSITWDGIWQFNDLEAAGVPYAAAPIPVIGEEDAVWASSHNFFLPRQATPDENKLNAAKVFIAWMSENSDTWAGSGMIPARTSVREGGALDGAPQEPIAAKVDSMKFLPPVPGLGTVQAETLEVGVDNAILGEQEPKEALSKVAAKASQLMEENQASFGK
ncbi:ABC transporter substrate-binding protein [Arthrobacter crusticola]|uniref:ABC transporter substrate-binding protein n=1 Tax=Arthrobacter crusticola TaxID=2547960 RepID=A0A4R5TZ56_9MICC|nr:ABC transporter substrate-binding protein [Arthrobacter crusticola]TDK26510.1 ABC transporter substrate-binding protein [Arthrobacter crusticola]